MAVGLVFSHCSAQKWKLQNLSDDPSSILNPTIHAKFQVTFWAAGGKSDEWVGAPFIAQFIVEKEIMTVQQMDQGIDHQTIFFREMRGRI